MFTNQIWKSKTKMSNTFTAKLVLGITIGVAVNAFFVACYFRKKKKGKEKTDKDTAQHGKQTKEHVF